jgi:hypothetical protein
MRFKKASKEQIERSNESSKKLIKEIREQKEKRDLFVNENYDFEYEKIYARHEDSRVMRQESLLGYTKQK